MQHKLFYFFYTNILYPAATSWFKIELVNSWKAQLQISSPKLETKFASYFGICKARTGKNNKNAPL